MSYTIWMYPKQYNEMISDGKIKIVEKVYTDSTLLELNNYLSQIKSLKAENERLKAQVREVREYICDIDHLEAENERIKGINMNLESQLDTEKSIAAAEKIEWENCKSMLRKKIREIKGLEK